MSANSTISSKRRADLGAAHAEDGAVEEDVLAPGQLRVEAGPDLEQRADPAGHLGPAGARLGDPREQFQQRALAGAVVADQADRFAAARSRRRRRRSAQSTSTSRLLAAADEPADGAPARFGDGSRAACRSAALSPSW